MRGTPASSTGRLGSLPTSTWRQTAKTSEYGTRLTSSGQGNRSNLQRHAAAWTWKGGKADLGNREARILARPHRIQTTSLRFNLSR